MGWGTGIERRLDKLAAMQARDSGSIQNRDPYQFRLSPTCPPSTSVTFRGGWAWRVSGYLIEHGYHIPSYTVDLTDELKTLIYGMPSPYTYTFANANWYKPALFVVRPMSTPPETWPEEVLNYQIYLYCRIGGEDDLEYETAAEAETGFQQIIGDQAANSGAVCGGIIIKNNGNTIEPNQYEVVDKVNRGRSYLFGGKRYGWNLG